MSNYKNLASIVLENSGQTTDTSITVPSTTAALFPTPPFYATIMPTNSGLANGSNSEIVEVTAATTSGANTIFSISRAQRGTSAISWDANEAILSHAIYTQDMPFIDDVLSTPSSVAYVATDNIQTSAVTTPKIADGAVTSDKIDWTTIKVGSERVVGYLDSTSQPIYEQTFSGSISVTSPNVSSGVNLISGVSRLLDAYGYVQRNNIQFPLPYVNTTAFTSTPVTFDEFCRIYRDASGVVILNLLSLSTRAYDYVIVLRYTKSS